MVMKALEKLKASSALFWVRGDDVIREANIWHRDVGNTWMMVIIKFVGCNILN